MGRIRTRRKEGVTRITKSKPNVAGLDRRATTHVNTARLRERGGGISVSHLRPWWLRFCFCHLGASAIGFTAHINWSFPRFGEEPPPIFSPLPLMR